MKADSLPPIPTPASRQWRQLRIRFLPPLTFLAVLSVTVWLWGRNLASPVMLGTAEGLEAEVSSPKSGRLSQLDVKLYQEVTAGQLLAVIEAVEPNILSNKLGVIRAEMELIRVEGGFRSGDRLRYSQFQLEIMLRRVDLALHRLSLPLAQLELSRTESLYKEKIVAQTVYDYAKLYVEQLQAQIKEMEDALVAADGGLKKLDPAAVTAEDPSIRAKLEVEEQKLHLAESELCPVLLKAPITGRVSKITKLAGMSVASNDPILTIANPKVDRILGFIGQPLRLEPKVGTAVEIRSRNAQRTVGKSHITHVGPRVELFNAPLRVRGMGSAQERGLPILIDVPEGMELRPGEMVDIFFRKEG